MPPKAWNSTWPLGLDMLIKALRYARTMHILQFFVDVVDENGTTFEQKLLGARGIDTVDPENIETILSTSFDGGSGCLLERLETLTTNIFLCRLRAWSTGPSFPASPGEWDLHSRRCSLETLTSTFATTIRIEQVPEF